MAYLSSLHGSTYEVCPKVEVVNREDGFAGAFVPKANRGTWPIMAMQNVWSAGQRYAAWLT